MHPPIDIIGGQVKRPARAKAFRPSSDESRQKNDADDAATRAAADAAAKARADAAARARAEAEAGGGGGGGVAGHDGWNAASLMMMTPRTRARLLAAGSQQQAGAETGKIRDRRRHWDMKTWRPIGLGPPPSDSYVLATPRKKEDHGRIRRIRKTGTDDVFGRTKERDARLVLDTPSRRLACRTDEKLTEQIERLLIEAYLPPNAIADDTSTRRIGWSPAASRSAAVEWKALAGRPRSPAMGLASRPHTTADGSPPPLPTSPVPHSPSETASGTSGSSSTASLHGRRTATRATPSTTSTPSPSSARRAAGRALTVGGSSRRARPSPSSSPTSREARRLASPGSASSAASVNLLFSEEQEQSPPPLGLQAETEQENEHAAAARARPVVTVEASEAEDAAAAESAFETISAAAAARGTDRPRPSSDQVASALVMLNRLCEVDAPAPSSAYASEEGGVDEASETDLWDESAPPCIVRQSRPGDVISYERLISAVLGAMVAHGSVETVQAPGGSLISRLANCDAAKQLSVDAGALEVVAAALTQHERSAQVQQCAALAVLKLTLPGQARPDSRDAMRVQRAIDAGILSALEAVVEEHQRLNDQSHLPTHTPYEAILALESEGTSGATSSPSIPAPRAIARVAEQRPSVPPPPLPPLRVRLSAAASAWLQYVKINFLAATPAREPGAYANKLENEHYRNAPVRPPGPIGVDLRIGPRVGASPAAALTAGQGLALPMAPTLGWHRVHAAARGPKGGALDAGGETTLWDDVFRSLRAFKCLW